MNKENLTKLADWVEKNVTQEQFDMESFRSFVREDSKFKITAQYISESDCGTIGCLLGWAPFVPGLELKPDAKLNGMGGKCFYEYSNEVFGGDTNTEEWKYLFCSTWTAIDNSVAGAVARIRNYVNGGETKTPWRGKNE